MYIWLYTNLNAYHTHAKISYIISKSLALTMYYTCQCMFSCSIWTIFTCIKTLWWCCIYSIYKEKCLQMILKGVPFSNYIWDPCNLAITESAGRIHVFNSLNAWGKSTEMLSMCSTLISEVKLNNSKNHKHTHSTSFTYYMHILLCFKYQEYRRTHGNRQPSLVHDRTEVLRNPWENHKPHVHPASNTGCICMLVISSFGARQRHCAIPSIVACNLSCTVHINPAPVVVPDHCLSVP